MNETIRVAIAEDQQLVNMVLARFIDAQPDMEMVGEAHNGEEAVAICRREKPDVILMDISMPVMDGVSATREILTLSPGTRVVVLTVHADDMHVFRGIKAGAQGYLLKNCSPEELAAAIKTVHSGDTIVSPAIAEKALAIFEGRVGPVEQAPHLTERELQILKALAEGRSRKQLAQDLFISANTVRNHTASIYKKLHVYDRAQATLYAVRHGLIDLKNLDDPKEAS